MDDVALCDGVAQVLPLYRPVVSLRTSSGSLSRQRRRFPSYFSWPVSCTMINQPSNRIQLTNVSIVRLKKGGKRFEVRQRIWTQSVFACPRASPSSTG